MKQASLRNKIMIPIVVLIVAIMAISTAITYFLSSRSFNANAIGTLH